MKITKHYGKKWKTQMEKSYVLMNCETDLKCPNYPKQCQYSM